MLSKNLAVATAVSALMPLGSAFDAQSKSNVAIYYGQGYDQPRLSRFCEDPALDIINIGFINVFPDAGDAGWPGSNFGNQCNGDYYEIGGVKTQLLSGCHQLIEDIPICQQAGKKVLLSLGGASPADKQRVLSDESAIQFADFLWAAFGPQTDAWVEIGGPRPFSDVVVDGFDFDIEHNGDLGYDTMVRRLREHYAAITDRSFYISGAPQCIIPDAQLGRAISNSWFDFIWVQFYNTWGCSARDFFSPSSPGASFNYDAWVEVIKDGANPSAKLYIGLLGGDISQNGFYLSPNEVKPLVSRYMDLYPDTFGGVMIWEATSSELNQVNGSSFAGNVKAILNERASTPTLPSSNAPVPFPTTSKTSTSSRPVIPTVTSTSRGRPTGTPSSSRAIPSRTASPSSSETPTASSHSVSFLHPTSESSTPPTTLAAITSAPATVTTVIVTSYTTICPTGFTTITTTYTTTYCPGTVTVTVTTKPPSVTGSTASVPEGWTTTVTVCTQCAATPTTVTLTVPAETTTNPPANPVSQVSTAPVLPEGWTTTVTVCTECAPTPTTLTVTVPVEPALEATGGPNAPSSSTETYTLIPIPAHPTSSRPLIPGAGAGSAPHSSTLAVRPSPSGSARASHAWVTVVPSGTQVETPVFTGAGVRSVSLSEGVAALVVVGLMVFAVL
ncbi:class III chitinase ChiA1 [Aspergillus candidus]|uniref:chitinase n=1 Tax=Aspergillus candidus TaxID=41067 RepID=A0A2I2FP42_ASPCN|nr:glycoside hydrolase superfamily [Aspergillus candidus]PLB42382.1 glycoside hydrolase superfamily [Aspergillus candidus]